MSETPETPEYPEVQLKPVSGEDLVTMPSAIVAVSGLLTNMMDDLGENFEPIVPTLIPSATHSNLTALMSLLRSHADVDLTPVEIATMLQLLDYFQMDHPLTEFLCMALAAWIKCIGLETVNWSIYQAFTMTNE